MAIRRILRPEHEAQGLSVEDDEDFVYLIRIRRGKRRVLATFNAHSVTAEAILNKADWYISKGGQNAKQDT